MLKSCGDNGRTSAMKIIITALLLSFSAKASSPQDLFCAYKSALKYRDIVRFRSFARDKYRHCTVSCIVGIECGITSTALIGIAKEIYDVFGPGSAEWEDLLANIMGLRISRRTSVNDLKSCSSACKTYYPVGNAIYVSRKL